MMEGKSDLLAGLKQSHEVIREKDVWPKFCDGVDLRFQAQHQGECNLQFSNGHHRTGNEKKL